MLDDTPNRLVKMAGLSALVLGVIMALAAHALAAQADYLQLLAVVMAASSGCCGTMLWWRPYFEARLAMIVLACAGVLGQIANWVWGLPGADQLRGETSTLFWLAFVLEMLTVLLLTIDTVDERRT